MDGFQADTEEEEEEEDGDCMIVDIPDVDGENGSSPAAWGGREE
jgi:chromatin assembly factor 1 subunit A